MRIRTVKPDFFKDEHLADQKPLNRILFAGLWCLADCEGRLEDRPRYIKVEVLPYDTADVGKMLDELADGGFIRRYESGDRKYIQVVNFLKHQRITGKEAETHSQYPKPTTEGNNGETLGKHPGNIGDIPDAQEGKGREGKGKERKGISPLPPLGVSAWFEEIWKKYPNRDGKKAALRHYLKSVKSESDRDLCLKALAVYQSTRAVRDGYTKAGSTWFNNWRDWVDYVEPTGPAAKPQRHEPIIPKLEAM